MIIALDKPSGISSHSSVEKGGRDGFKEALELRTGRTLWLGHRLDKETAGLILVGTTAQDAQALGEAFDHSQGVGPLVPLGDPLSSSSGPGSSQIKKTYVFATRPSPNAAKRQEHYRLKPGADLAVGSERPVAYVVKSHIGKGKTSKTSSSRFYSIDPTKTEPMNAVTEFARMQITESGIELWQAKPITGKPHQIRLHAEALGLSLLGDTEHGGSPFPFMCLFASEVKMGEQSYTAIPPRWIESPELLDRPELASWLNAIERRERWFRSLEALSSEDHPFRCPQSLRWIDQDGGILRMDQLNELIHFHIYPQKVKSDRQLSPSRSARKQNANPSAQRDTWLKPPTREDLSLLAHAVGRVDWFSQGRLNRGAIRSQSDDSPNTVETSRPDFIQRFTIEENGQQFEMRVPEIGQSGQSIGLFLDQRENRAWVKANSKGLSVLNLFAYTGGFSIAAAAGGASEVVSVDLSKTYLNWIESNFLLNQHVIDLKSIRTDQKAMDAFRYLDWCIQKDKKFDLIVCDPPSFARVPGSDRNVFQIEKHGVELWQKTLRCLKHQNAKALLSCNYEGFSFADFRRQIVEATQMLRPRSFALELAPATTGDFDLPGDDPQMKSLIVTT